MNYLAHAYLSFNDPEILLGNMISDFVKGRDQYGYPQRVQLGIRLHRAIDQFTDTHAATQQLKSFYRPQYRLYSGAFADVTYDYFLANDPLEFASEQELGSFSKHAYQLLSNQASLFPPKFDRMFPYMQSQDWLQGYRSTGGIRQSFGGLVRRSRYLNESDIAFDLFLQHLGEMQACYNAFFPSLKKFAADHFAELSNS